MSSWEVMFVRQNRDVRTEGSHMAVLKGFLIENGFFSYLGFYHPCLPHFFSFVLEIIGQMPKQPSEICLTKETKTGISSNKTFIIEHHCRMSRISRMFLGSVLSTLCWLHGGPCQFAV